MHRYTIVFITIIALRVSGSSFAHHQELKTVYTASVFVEFFLLLTAIVGGLELAHDRCKKQKKLDKYPMQCIQFWAPDDGRRNCLKHVEQL
jgi:hypothetical protein